MRRLLGIATALALMALPFAASSGAADVRIAQSVDLTGDWDWTNTAGDGTTYQSTAVIDHDVSGGNLGWSWSNATATGTVSGTDWEMDGSGGGYTFHFEGTILENGNRMEGDWTQSDGQSGTTVATRIGGPPAPEPACAGPPEALVSCWHAEGNADDDGGDNDGSLQNGLTFGPGKVGQAFKSTSEGAGYVDIGSPPDLKLSDFTVALWVKVGSTAFVNHPGHGMVGWSTDGWNLGLGGSISGGGGYSAAPGEPYLTWTGHNNVAATGMPIPDQNWHHVAVTKNGSSVRFYVDATEFVVPQEYAPGYTFDTDFNVAPPGGLPNSYADEIHVFDRALTADEVVALAATADRPPQCADTGAICGGSEDEELQGTPEDEFIFGGGGNDKIDGGGGNDVIVGGDGNDVISGGAGKDKITGGAGKDRIVGDGKSAPDPSAQDAWVSAAQSASSADQLSGGGGNDTVIGQAGNDKLKGDGGNDLLKGGSGVNDFNGGPGKDTCVLENKKDETKSCEKKKLNFKLNFLPWVAG